MALNAFIKIGSAAGEARQGRYGREKWIELQGWDWEVEAETSWTKGGGASVGKPNPGKLTWEHYWDKSAHFVLGYICTGTAFQHVELHMCKGTGPVKEGMPEPFLKVQMKEAFITKVSNSATEEGNVLQKVEMVFKAIVIDYHAQGEDPKRPGALAAAVQFSWDIPEGRASPSTGA